MIKRPLKFSNFILQIFLGHEVFLEKSGDLEEVYSGLVEEVGPFRAYLWYWFQVLKAVPVFVVNSICWRCTMLRNYLKISWRNLMKHKGYSMINIAGLAIGLTFSILIMLYVQYEFSYDRYHESPEEIYRVVIKIDGPAWLGSNWFNVTPGILKSVMEEQCPEVKCATRICYWSSIIGFKGLVRYRNNSHIESDLLIVDPEFLEIFTFPLISGNPRTALSEPFSVLITRKIAQKYFGDQDPLNKILTFKKNMIIKSQVF